MTHSQLSPFPKLTWGGWSSRMSSGSLPTSCVPFVERAPFVHHPLAVCGGRRALLCNVPRLSGTCQRRAYSTQLPVSTAISPRFYRFQRFSFVAFRARGSSVFQCFYFAHLRFPPRPGFLRQTFHIELLCRQMRTESSRSVAVPLSCLIITADTGNAIRHHPMRPSIRTLRRRRWRCHAADDARTRAAGW